jgi:hypothetical protein
MNDQLNTALTHVSTIYGLYIGQRQNLVSYYLAGVGLLSIAYAAAIDKHRAPVAVAVCALGLLASASAYLQDSRLGVLMKAAEMPLRELQTRLADEVHSEAVRIQEAIDGAPQTGPSRGTQIRLLYGAVALVFILGAVYAGAAT